MPMPGGEMECRRSRNISRAMLDAGKLPPISAPIGRGPPDDPHEHEVYADAASRAQR
jgi:hypothetical protein